jgi:hypothetical protein
MILPAPFTTGCHRHHHVRPDDAGDDVDVVLLQHLLGDLHADVGLGLVVAVDHFRLEPADLAAEMVERELDRVLHVGADHALRTAHGGDEADLDLLLRRRRRSRSKQCGEGGDEGRENGFAHDDSSSGKRKDIPRSACTIVHRRSLPTALAFS